MSIRVKEQEKRSKQIEKKQKVKKERKNRS